MAVIDYSYLGSGRTYLRNTALALGFVEVGNASVLNFAVTEALKTLKDFQNPGGGTRNEVRRIDAVECSMTLHDLNPENIALATFGSYATQLADVAKTNQSMGSIGFKGGFVPFPQFYKTSVAPVVRAKNGRTAAARANSAAVALNAYLVPAAPNGYFYKVSVAGTTAGAPPAFGTVVGGTTVDGTATLTNMGKILLAAGTDYDLLNGGILLKSAAEYTNGEELESDYTTVGQDLVQALVKSAQTFEMFFDGVNEARSGKRASVRAFKITFGAAQNIGLIGEDHAALQLSGKLTAEASRAVGLSQYFEAAMEQ